MVALIFYKIPNNLSLQTEEDACSYTTPNCISPPRTLQLPPLTPLPSKMSPAVGAVPHRHIPRTTSKCMLNVQCPFEPYLFWRMRYSAVESLSWELSALGVKAGQVDELHSIGVTFPTMTVLRCGDTLDDCELYVREGVLNVSARYVDSRESN